MQVEPTIVQTLGALVYVEASAVKGSSEATVARWYQLADEGAVGIDASAKFKFAVISTMKSETPKYMRR